MVVLGIALLLLGGALLAATISGVDLPFLETLGGAGYLIGAALLVTGLGLILVGARAARARESAAPTAGGPDASVAGWTPPPSIPASPTGSSPPASPTSAVPHGSGSSTAATPAAGSAPLVSGSVEAVTPSAQPTSPTGERPPESPTADTRPAEEAPPPTERRA